jgi:hypothetical protein
MDNQTIRKYLHDLSNALNAAKINAYLLRRMHGEALDRETMSGLESALHDSELLVSQFHKQVHQEITPTEAPARRTEPVQPTGQSV